MFKKKKYIPQIISPIYFSITGLFTHLIMILLGGNQIREGKNPTGVKKEPMGVRTLNSPHAFAFFNIYNSSNKRPYFVYQMYIIFTQYVYVFVFVSAL